MLDPFLPPIPFLSALAVPIAEAFDLRTLPLHIHEVLLAFAFYYSINIWGAPWISRRLFPQYYNHFNKRTKANWDVHVVSLVQSCLINTLALWVMWTDDERRDMDWTQRVWGYTGGGGMIQGFAAGYFLWDLCVCITNVQIFGLGLLAHAVSALVVFSLGFRPFVNFYGPTFILYELSSPFLNFHWFFDKVNMTGSRAQLYNGILLIGTFFLCRLVWGSYQSVRVYQDVWAAIHAPDALVTTANLTVAATEKSVDAGSEIMRFAGDRAVPTWLAGTYMGSNIVLNALNFYWFGKMIETIKKRFQPPKEKAAIKIDGRIGSQENGKVEIGAEGKKTVSAGKTEVRRRKA